MTETAPPYGIGTRILRMPLRQEARKAVLEWILDGTLSPGSDVNEASLAASLGVSRTPLREALLALEQDGFLVSETGRGFRVVPLTERDVEEIYPMLWTLEGLAVRDGANLTVERKRRLGAAAIGALVALSVVLLGAGALFAAFKDRLWPEGGGGAGGGGGSGTGGTIDAGRAPVVEDVDAGASPLAVVDAGSGASSTVTPPVKPVCPSGVKPTTLVMRAIKDRYSELTACFEKHKAQLPEDQGKLMVTFHIAPNGKIVDAKADLPGAPKVTGCVEERLKGIRVPCYNGGDATANLPLQWSVKR